MGLSILDIYDLFPCSLGKPMLLSRVGYFSTFSMAILSAELLACHLDSKKSIVPKGPTAHASVTRWSSEELSTRPVKSWGSIKISGKTKVEPTFPSERLVFNHNLGSEMSFRDKKRVKRED